MEPRHATFQFHPLKPVAEETADETNCRIRRVVPCALFYDDALVNADMVIDLLIGQECTLPLYPDEEEKQYRFDDVVWIGERKVRLHLSRPLLMTA